MKYAFSTLACPGWNIEQVIDSATRYGYDGIELRLLDGKIIDPLADRQEVIAAVANCRAHGIEVCVLDTSCRFNIASTRERALQGDDLLRWISLAHEVQVPILRIFGGASQDNSNNGNTQDVTKDEDYRVVESLRDAVHDAEQAKITIALETHDAFSSARRVSHVIGMVASPYVAAIWDSHHPYRIGESMQEVLTVLSGHIAHVHVKDARKTGNNDWQLVLMGEGEVPVREQLQLLQQAGYDGYVSVEWEKKWHPEIAEPEIALPQHIKWLKND